MSCYQTCLKILIQIAYEYSCKWRYQFNYDGKTVFVFVVVFGESPVSHSVNMKTRQWNVGPNSIYELSEHVNLGVFKNYCGSFDKNIDENITKTRKKAGMLFSAYFDRRRTNPLIYVKFWKLKRHAYQLCLLEPSFGLSQRQDLINWKGVKGGSSKNFFTSLTILKALFYISLVVFPQLALFYIRKGYIFLVALFP